MKHSVEHPLEPARARDLLDRALATYREHYAENSVETSWIDERTAAVDFEVTGRRVAGCITVCDDCYDIDLRLPWMLRPFKRRIAESFETELQRWIARA